MSRRSGPRSRPSGRGVRAAGPAGSALSLHGSAPASEDTAHAWAMRLAWLVLALFGIALLVIALGPHKIGDNFAETDFYGGYAQGARALEHGHVDPARYGVVGPGYEVALALLGLVVPNLLLAAELLSIASILAGAALWLRLLATRANAPLALVASLFLVTNVTFLRYGYSATNDSLAFALMAGSLYGLLARPGRRAAILAGALGGLAFLTRYNAVVLLPAGLVALLAGATPHAERRRAAVAFAVGFLAPVLPWVAFSLARGQSFHFQFFHNIAYDVFARSKGIAWDDYQKLMQPQFHSLGDVIARDPGAVLRREVFNLWEHLRLDARVLVGLPVALCALVGLALSWIDGTLRRLWPILLVSGLLFLTLVPIFYSERYGLPLIPCYAAFAAVAFTSPTFALAFGRSRRFWLKPAAARLQLRGQGDAPQSRAAPGGGAGLRGDAARAAPAGGSGDLPQAADRVSRRSLGGAVPVHEIAARAGAVRPGARRALALFLLAGGGDAARGLVSARHHLRGAGAHDPPRRPSARGALRDRPRVRSRAGLGRQ